VQFVQKVMNDRMPNLAVLLAWGALSTLFPALLGLFALTGLVLQDQQRLDQISDMIFSLMPVPVAATLRDVLARTRVNAGLAELISIFLVFFNGANFFAGMESVFNLAYHVADRNLILQRVVGVLVLVAVTALALLSTVAYSLGALVSTESSALLAVLPFVVPRNLVAAAIGQLVSVLTAGAIFLVLYRVLPHRDQTWRQALPGTLLATLLLLVIVQVFPLYLKFFGQGFEVYAVFGVFLLLMLWLYLLGLVLVLGAELNAFLEEPGRSAALAQTTARAEVGQVEAERAPGRIQTRATGAGQTGGDETDES
jgi:membrane protein